MIKKRKKKRNSCESSLRSTSVIILDLLRKYQKCMP